MLNLSNINEIHSSLLKNIYWISQHGKESSVFSLKKNDHLLKNFLEDLIYFSELKTCSDIHIEPQENNIRIRFRIDGILQEGFELPPFIFEQLCCKLKLLANMNIAESRLPQDGKFIFEHHNKLKIHIRMSTCPTIRGEKIVLRLLNNQKTEIKLESLGMTDLQLSQFINAIHYPYGLILITGPTGSGKTSTLYAAINKISSISKNIITLEDPVEVYIPGINQIHIKGELKFSSILRSILRQDPDIIMIGEIRDEETAQIAIQAANTGHLVLATLHTNSCIETIHRLKHMNIDQNDLISCLKMIVSQRLLRKKSDSDHEYSGRIGLFEVLEFNEALKLYVYDHLYCQEDELIKNHGFYPMSQHGMDCVRNGITTYEEIKRILNIDLNPDL